MDIRSKIKLLSVFLNQPIACVIILIIIIIILMIHVFCACIHVLISIFCLFFWCSS